jgi:hypothetical protein
LRLGYVGGYVGGCVACRNVFGSLRKRVFLFSSLFFFFFFFLFNSITQQVLKALTETLHLNLAACYLRTEQLDKCIKACTVAVGVNPNSAKVQFRNVHCFC